MEQTWVQSQLHSFWICAFGNICFNSLCLGFLICKTGKVAVLLKRGNPCNPCKVLEGR